MDCKPLTALTAVAPRTHFVASDAGGAESRGLRPATFLVLLVSMDDGGGGVGGASKKFDFSFASCQVLIDPSRRVVRHSLQGRTSICRSDDDEFQLRSIHGRELTI